MVSKVGYVCVLAILIQKISGQCIGNMYNANYGHSLAAAVEGAAIAGLVNNAYASGLVGMPASDISSGGGLVVRSSSSIPPSGLTVQSDNLLFEGPLSVSGQMPFLGVVALEGPLAAAGSGSVAYGCGNGNVGIVSEGLGLAPAGNNVGLGLGLTSLGYNGLPIY